MSRLIIVSNRLPVSVSLQEEKISFHQSVGGVATGISSLSEPKERLWFGWPGLAGGHLTSEHRQVITEGLHERGCRPVFLNEIDIQDFYSGFSNKTIWPLFHYFPQYTNFDEHFWKAYQRVNHHFCDEVVQHVTEQDIIWIHDYQLMLLPQLIRTKIPNARIGFFLHIPFPSFELIRHLPWRVDILEGLLGADLIGFHEYDYVRHFLSCVHRITGHEHNLSEMIVNNRLIRVDAFPMGIDYEKYANSGNLPEVRQEINKIHNHKNVQIILSVDRLDYTKGIITRLEAFDWFLTKHPEYRGKVTLIVVAVPSRTSVEQYGLLRDEIEKTVSRINGTYGSLDWTPISYLYQSLPFHELAALYNLADTALITPLRDGMNLVAKEFIAAQLNKEKQGILILSEMAGAACELAEAIVINPYNKERIVTAIKEALEMPQSERLRRNNLMHMRISRYTVGRWAGDFIHSLEQVKNKQEALSTQDFSPGIQHKTFEAYKNASKRLFLLDYDGTLVGFQKLPEEARPDAELLDLLNVLSQEPRNEAIVISGRDRDTLTQWLGKLPINLIAEHGAFCRKKNQDWKNTVPPNTEWKEIIRPILDLYVDRTPGSFIEEKNFSLVWHCRKTEPDLAKLRTQEIKDALMALTSNLSIGVFEGSKIVEVKLIGVNKGQAAQIWLAHEQWPFIFCAGDDYTDEDMFTALPEGAVSCKIGPGPSKAKYRLNEPTQIRNYLKELSKL